MSTHVALALGAEALLQAAVGYAALYGLGLARPRLGELRLLGLAYLLGFALLGLGTSFVLMAGGAADPGTVLALAGAIALVCLAAGRLAPKLPPARAAVSGGRLGAAAALLAAAILALASLAALATALRTTWWAEYDAVWFWLPKVDVIFYHHGLWLGTGGWQAVESAEYPPLASAMDAVTYGFVGGAHPSLLPLEACLLGLAFLGSLLALLDRFVPRWLSWPAAALLVATPGYDSHLQSLLPDQTVGYLLTAGVLCCVLWLRERRAAWLALAVAFLAATSLTKVEGDSHALLVALVVIAGCALTRNWARARSALLLLAGPGAIVPWRLWLGAHGVPAGAAVYALSDLLHPLFLAHQAGRLPYAASSLALALFRVDQWLLVLPLALAATLAVARRCPQLAAGWLAWLSLGFLELLAVYWIGSLPIHQYVRQTVHRVSDPLLLVAAAMLPVLLGLGLEAAREGHGAGPELQPTPPSAS